MPCIIIFLLISLPNEQAVRETKQLTASSAARIYLIQRAVFMLHLQRFFHTSNRFIFAFDGIY